MALPLLESLEDCGDFSKTVKPFLPQLYELPHQVLNNITDLSGLTRLYVETNPLISGFAASLTFGAILLVLSEINRNYSQVDRMWSLLPNLYNIHLAVWARLAGVPHGRIDLVTLFTTLWSTRLTFNYWRKGGYEIGSEDYRWNIVKSRIPGPIWFIFNVTFISFYQSVLLFSISCIPSYTILLSSQFKPSLTKEDPAFFLVECALILSQVISDGQQWVYHAAKDRYKKNGQDSRRFNKADLERGFLTSGLWAFSRHPNFLAEQTIWFVLYQWGCSSTNNLYNWTFVGAGSLILLFQGSTWLTEAISASKYPEYKHYQKQVGMFLPASSSGYTPPPKATGRQQGRNNKKQI